MTRRFFRLNAWALVLDFSALVLLPFVLVGRAFFPFFVAGIIVCLFLAFNGIRLHAHYTSRVKVLDILIKKNKAEFRQDTFREFMYAPCGRMLVREALDTLGYSYQYRDFARQYPLFSRRTQLERTSLEIIPYNDDTGALN